MPKREPEPRFHVPLQLPSSYRKKIRAIQKQMFLEPEFRGRLGNQSVVRYALDKVYAQIGGREG